MPLLQKKTSRLVLLIAEIIVGAHLILMLLLAMTLELIDAIHRIQGALR